MGCQWLVGLLSRDRLPMVSRVSLYDRGEIIIGSSDNSGGVVVGALVCREQNVAGSTLALCSDFFFFLFTCRNFFKFLRATPARSQYSMLHKEQKERQ